MQLGQNAGKLLAGHVEQGGIGKHSIKSCARQIEVEKLLADYFAAAVPPCHFAKRLAAIKPHWSVAQRCKIANVAAGTTTEIQYIQSRFALAMGKERAVILGDIVIFCALPKGLCIFAVVVQGCLFNILKLLWR